MPSYVFDDEEPAKPKQKGYVYDDEPPAPASSGQRSLSDVMLGKPAPLTRTERGIKGLRDPIDGGAQLLTKTLGAMAPGFVQGVNKANNWLADKTGLVARLPEGGVDQQVRQDEDAYQKRRAAHGQTGIDGWRLTGNIVNPANLALAARAPQAASLLGRVGVGATLGAVNGAITPVGGDGDFLDEKLKQTALGATVGGAIPGVAAAAGRIISPLASKNKNLKLLRSEGVNPTIGQALGGMANKLEEKLTSVPIMGDMISRSRRIANEEFERAAHNRALKPIGEALPKGLSGRDAVNHTEKALKAKYEDVLTKIGAIRPDAQFNQKVAELTDMVNKLPVEGGMQAKFGQSISEIASSIDRRGYMTSQAFKDVESSLGKDAKKLFSSQDTWDGKVAPAIKQLQQELRDMLKRQAGRHADDLRDANAGWANFKNVQAAAGKIGAEEGKFSPAQFQNAVRGNSGGRDKSQFARGSALGQDLGDAGKVVLGNKVPDSGTAGRLGLGGLAVGAGAINPLIPVGLGAGAAAYSQPVQRLMVDAVARRGQSAETMAEFLRRTSPYLTGASAPIGGGLLE